MTIKKAYDELEEGGYIKTTHGKGSFVCTKNIELAKEWYKKAADQNYENAIKALKRLG